MRLKIYNSAMLVIAAVGLGAANLSHAQSYVSSDSPAQQQLHEAFQIDVGIFVLSQSTKASLNGQSVQNPEIDFNQAFGTGYDTSRFRVDGLWRITERNHLYFMYFTNGVSRTRAIDPATPIEWGDYSFYGNVTARNRLNVYELGYEYAFIKNQSFELSAGIGVHYTQVKIDMNGTATLNGPNGPTTVTGAAKQASVPAPLPVLSLRSGWAFADSWVLDATVQALGISYDQFNGNWWDLKAGVTYLFTKNIGLGVAYDDFKTSLSISQNSFEGRLHLNYRGGMLFVRGAF
jgi:hypothetical protein